MPDDIKLPGLGKVDKKWVLIGGAGALGLIVIIVIRRKSAGQSTDGTSTDTTSADTSGTDSGIDPATGVPYADEGGSSGIDPATGIPYAEESAGYGAVDSGYGGNGAVGMSSDYDAAGYPIGSAADLAWQAQQEGISTGTTSGAVTTTGITSNSDWVSEAESGVIPGSILTISTALSKVLGGVAVTTAQRNLFLEAVGVLGQPPQGYPQPIKLKDTPGQPAKGAHTKTISAPGNEDVSQIAHAHHTTGGHLLALNPFLHKWYPGNKHVPKGEKIKVPA